VRLASLHHVTAICSDARRTAGFYRDLGLRLVKRTVNYDEPSAYHLYFGDDEASPGSLLTFFEWPRAGRGRLGRGVVESIGLVVPGTKEYRRIVDPDGLNIDLVPGDWMALSHVAAFGEPSLYSGMVDWDSPLRFLAAPPNRGVYGPGVTHHVAFRLDGDAEQGAARQELIQRGLRPTRVFDRTYFHSVYFRMADSLLLELATDGPGFTVDEPPEQLGATLKLPGWLEAERASLESQLLPI
jgi:glyoxalase family protein